MNTRRLLAIGITSLLGALLCGVTSTATEPISAADKLAAIAWAQGSWKTSVDGDYLDEFWSPPQADSMIGMFRWSKKDRLWMSEMLSIVTEGETIVLRVKHFDRAMVGWEERDKPITLPLIRQTADESVFETDDKAHLVRLTYRKTGSDTMDVILDVTEPEKNRHHEFHFKRF